MLNFEVVRYVLKTDTGVERAGSLEDVLVSDRLGNVERKLTLEDGSIFTTNDNDAVDQAFKPFIKNNSFIHSIESNMSLVLVSLALIAGLTFSFFKWGVPWSSKAIAHALPMKTNELIGASTLEFLDEHIFEKSALDEARQNEIRDHFKSTLLPLDEQSDSINYKLHFRAWEYFGEGIPNALALPSGDIIVTDKFVELSKSQDEIDSVLLHEMGHIVHRHSLQTLVQGTLVTVVVMMVTGDASGMADMGIGLGSVLISTTYSRGHESEADQYAFKKMLAARINPESFASIMERITSYDFSDSEKKEEQSGEVASEDPKTTQPEASVGKDAGTSENPKNDDESFFDYLSTHPSTQKRIDEAKRYAQCYRKGLIVCDYAQKL